MTYTSGRIFTNVGGGAAGGCAAGCAPAAAGDSVRAMMTAADFSMLFSSARQLEEGDGAARPRDAEPQEQQHRAGRLIGDARQAALCGSAHQAVYREMKD